MAWGPFFSCPRPVRMHLHDGAVQRHRLELDAHDLLALQMLENPVKHAVLRPAVHARVDGVPVAKAGRQAPPLATVLGHIQNGVENPEVGNADVAPLHWKLGRDAVVLSLSEFHLQTIARSGPLVLTRPRPAVVSRSSRWRPLRSPVFRDPGWGAGCRGSGGAVVGRSLCVRLRASSKMAWTTRAAWSPNSQRGPWWPLSENTTTASRYVEPVHCRQSALAWKTMENARPGTRRLR